MYRLSIALLLATVAVEVSSAIHLPPWSHSDHIKSNQTFRLCAPSASAFSKCNRLVVAAKNDNNNAAHPLQLTCVQNNNAESCIESVRSNTSDIYVGIGHDYPIARRAFLEPIVFERLSDKSLYIAVTDKGVPIEQILKMPIVHSDSDYRANHSAMFLNLRRGHEICERFKGRAGHVIRIVDSAKYNATPDDVLLCPNMKLAKPKDYRRCNVDAELQRAVFVRATTNWPTRSEILQLFRTILKRFGHNSSSNSAFNFFGTYEGVDDVIFGNAAVGFDPRPTYRNGVNEAVFDHLHCGTDHTHDDHDHDHDHK